jgi:hypothetical protein
LVRGRAPRLRSRGGALTWARADSMLAEGEFGALFALNGVRRLPWLNVERVAASI